jgi:hypothetical protein
LFDRPKPTVGCSANGRRRRKIDMKVVISDVEQCTMKIIMDVLYMT